MRPPVPGSLAVALCALALLACRGPRLMPGAVSPQPQPRLHVEYYEISKG